MMIFLRFFRVVGACGIDFEFSFFWLSFGAKERVGAQTKLSNTTGRWISL